MTESPGPHEAQAADRPVTVRSWRATMARRPMECSPKNAEGSPGAITKSTEARFIRPRASSVSARRHAPLVFGVRAGRGFLAVCAAGGSPAPFRAKATSQTLDGAWRFPPASSPPSPSPPALRRGSPTSRGLFSSPPAHHRVGFFFGATHGPRRYRLQATHQTGRTV